MNLKSYLEQHEAVEAEISIIKKLVTEHDLEKNASEIALHISTLAGKIKIHLAMEDQYLYPNLQKSKDELVRKLAVSYQTEMGNLAENFVAFKDKYNTKPKIIMNQNTIKQDINQIFGAIEKRVQKEENELYQFIG